MSDSYFRVFSICFHIHDVVARVFTWYEHSVQQFYTASDYAKRARPKRWTDAPHFLQLKIINPPTMHDQSFENLVKDCATGASRETDHSLDRVERDMQQAKWVRLA